MKIVLHNDYRGVLTGEIFYPAGMRDMPKEHGEKLIAHGRADLAGTMAIKKSPPKRVTTKRKQTRKAKK